MAASWPEVIVEPPGDVRAEVAVIGSGPGGAVTACLLAEAGRDVVLIEEGPLLALESAPPFSASRWRRSTATPASPSRSAHRA